MGNRPEGIDPGDAPGPVGPRPIGKDQRSRLAAKADAFIEDLVAQDVNSPEFSLRAEQIAHLGQREIAAAASNPVLTLPSRALAGTSRIGNDLGQLRAQIEHLDPARQGALLAPRKLFGLFPFGNRLRAYFEGYRRAQGRIATILARLDDGRRELAADILAIDAERHNAGVLLGKLDQMILLSRLLDARLERAAEAFDPGHPAKAKALRETALFHVQHRTQDLLNQAAVTLLSCQALDLIRQNMIALCEAVDRASAAFVAALRTAVAAAQALTGQALLLDHIAVLNEAAADPADKGHSLDTLGQAFRSLWSVLEQTDAIQLTALDTIKQASKIWEEEINSSRDYIAGP